MKSSDIAWFKGLSCFVLMKLYGETLLATGWGALGILFFISAIILQWKWRE